MTENFILHVSIVQKVKNCREKKKKKMFNFLNITGLKFISLGTLNSDQLKYVLCVGENQEILWNFFEMHSIGEY